MNLTVAAREALIKVNEIIFTVLNQMAVRINTWASAEHKTDGKHAAITATSLTASGTAGIGYTTGAGGTVTQATSKSTGVTLSTPSGQITMSNAALNAGVEVTFTVTNTVIAAPDVVVANHSSGGTSGAYLVGVSAVAAGSFALTVSNASAANLSEAIVLSFVVIKGASS